MKKVSALFLSITLAISPVAFAQSGSGQSSTAAGGGAAGAAGAAAGVTVGVVAAAVAAVAVAASVTANKSDPVYGTSGTSTVVKCIANC
jgi:membrane protease subunit (stomatin/prohibitin family)